MKAGASELIGFPGASGVGCLMCGLLSLCESASGCCTTAGLCALRTNVHILNSMATLGCLFGDSQRTLCNCFIM